MSIPCNVCENGNATCLHKVNIFQNLDLAQIEAVQKLIVQRKLTNGETLLFEGDLSDKLFIVRYGAIKLVRYGSDGREYVLDTLFPGDFYGGNQIFTSVKLHETAIAEGECGVCTIKREHLKDLMIDSPEIALKMISYLSTKLEQSRLQVEILSTKDVEKRVCMYIFDRYQRTNSQTLLITQEDIGSAIHLTKETVNRKLSTLQDLGLLEVFGKGKIKILDIAQLRKKAYW